MYDCLGPTVDAIHGRRELYVHMYLQTIAHLILAIETSKCDSYHFYFVFEKKSLLKSLIWFVLI